MPTQTILVVDDLATLRQPVRLTLERAGYAVEEASNGEEALFKIAESRPALVLLDLMMPTMNGIEVLKHMQANALMRRIPVIVLTAVADRAQFKRQAQMQKVDYLLKPFTSHTLLERVRRALDQEMAGVTA